MWICCYLPRSDRTWEWWLMSCQKKIKPSYLVGERSHSSSCRLRYHLLAPHSPQLSWPLQDNICECKADLLGSAYLHFSVHQSGNKGKSNSPSVHLPRIDIRKVLSLCGIYYSPLWSYALIFGRGKTLRRLPPKHPADNPLQVKRIWNGKRGIGASNVSETEPQHWLPRQVSSIFLFVRDSG